MGYTREGGEIIYNWKDNPSYYILNKIKNSGKEMRYKKNHVITQYSTTGVYTKPTCITRNEYYQSEKVTNGYFHIKTVMISSKKKYE